MKKTSTKRPVYPKIKKNENNSSDVTKYFKTTPKNCVKKYEKRQ